MLIAATVMTISIKTLSDVPDGAPSGAGPIVAGVTLAVSAALAIRATGVWKLWATLIGLASGSAVAVVLGLYDPQRVIDADWFFVPNVEAWPGFDLSPGADFWTLLPVFLIVSLVVAIKMSVDGVALQQVSRRRPPATDFRLVQGAVNVNGLGTLSSLLLSGGDRAGDEAPRLMIVARPGPTVELEFIAVFDEESLEDHLAYLDEQAEIPDERDKSFFLLRHYASSARHRKHHGVDIVAVEVER